MPVQSGYEVLRQSLERMGASLSVTRRALTLGSLDSVTGWYQKTFDESTINMLIIPVPSRIVDTEAGVKVLLQGTGFTFDAVEVGDQIETGTSIFYDVTTVTEIMLGDNKIVYHCNLSESDLGQGETPLAVWVVEPPPVNIAPPTGGIETVSGPEGYADSETGAVWFADPGSLSATSERLGGSYSDRE